MDLPFSRGTIVSLLALVPSTSSIIAGGSMFNFPSFLFKPLNFVRLMPDHLTC